MGDDYLPDFTADEPEMPSQEQVPDVCAYAFLDEVTDDAAPDDSLLPDFNTDAPAEKETIATETIKSSFRAADSNGDGMITPHELKALFQYLGDWSDENFEALMSAADHDQDGTLGYEEFVSWVMSSGLESDSLNMAPAYAQALAESAVQAQPPEVQVEVRSESYEQAVAEYAEDTPATTINSFDELQRCDKLDIVTQLSLTPIGNFDMENDGRYTVDMILKLKPYTTQLTSVKQLSLSDNQLGDEAMPALVSCLQCLPSLEVLELLWNGLTVVGCTTVMEALSYDAMPNLKKVSMYANPVQDDAEAVSKLISTFNEIRGEGDEAQLLISDMVFD